jgi:hypothetical protein
MLRSTSRGIFGLAVAALISTPLAHGQQVASPVQVSGAQLKDILAKETPWAGVNHVNGCVFLITGPAAARAQHFSCPDGTSDTVKGTSVVEGDMMCVTWPYAAKRCAEWYQVGDNTFHQKSKGNPATTHTIYRLK